MHTSSTIAAALLFTCANSSLASYSPCGDTNCLDQGWVPAATSIIGEILDHTTITSVETATKTMTPVASRTVTARWGNITIVKDGGYWYNQGCFISGSSNESDMADVLHVSSRLMRRSDEMDIRLCREYCAYYAPEENHEYFGVANGHECYCGNFISSHARRVDQSNCRAWCPRREDGGDEKLLCGGKHDRIRTTPTEYGIEDLRRQRDWVSASASPCSEQPCASR
ncbi:hypothetical protein P171DRAFT_484064 [Karstenula rhodostoma CBS 690.94]|uniref:WSC domain-containing protein n=1 Tax=Karstenula rhodostoma CBS 690.94 TaxID=1392251 RepID=A0A9P4UCM4_9PLEO|nr:hypothetical protein P171DRAFT_484064 [Karstenula rhodostoma CBS 690.94]